MPEYDVSKEEQDLLIALFSAYDKLRCLGWREAFHAPQPVKLWVIEPGSTGVHEGYRDGHTFWVQHDNTDTYPSNPVLFKLQ